VSSLARAPMTTTEMFDEFQFDTPKEKKAAKDGKKEK
jgi:hypothetical protein